MRQLIGTCIIVFNSEKKILLGKRLNSYKAGHYGLPGGRVEVGEPLSESAQRELHEETNLKGKSVTFLGTVRDCQGSYDFIHFAFLCQTFEGNLTTVEPDKCEEWNWYPFDKLPTPILPGHQGALDLYRNFLAGKTSFLKDISKSM